MGNIKEINIENWTCYFIDDLMNIKDFHSHLLKIDKKLYKKIDIYYIVYITMKDSEHVNINGVNPFYLIIDEVDGYIECNSIEEKNGNKYLILDSSGKNKKSIDKIHKTLRWN